jgi:hypothetical protein
LQQGIRSKGRISPVSSVQNLSITQPFLLYHHGCRIPDNDWYNRGGQYIAITGTVKKVDCSAILIDDMMIALEDIAGIDMCDVNT